MERKKKWQNKRAIILKASKYRMQYAYEQKRDLLYKIQLLHKHGGEPFFWYSWIALEQTVNQFNEMYDDSMTLKHGIVILAIKHYTTVMKNPEFYTKDIREFFPHLEQFGFKKPRGKKKFTQELTKLIWDISTMYLINPYNNRRSYVTTTRMKLFIATYNKHLEELLKGLIP